jgi:uncharacterized protein (UPF0179 family)
MVLTLVGASAAKTGARFEYLGMAPECHGCKLKQVCHAPGLAPHREYEVRSVRDVRHACPADFFEGGMRVAEVQALPVRGTIPASALRGNAVTHAFEECGAVCLFKRFCNTPALAPGADCAIKAIQEPVECKVGRDLRFALLEPRRGKAGA